MTREKDDACADLCPMLGLSRISLRSIRATSSYECSACPTGYSKMLKSGYEFVPRRTYVTGGGQRAVLGDSPTRPCHNCWRGYELLEEPMDKPRIFLGSSGKQEKLIQALTRGLGDIARVEPWTTSFNPGISTLERLLELTQEVDFAAFVFAQDDWTTSSPSALLNRSRARRLRGITLCSRPAFSAAFWECAEPSSSMQAERSFRAISWASRAYGTPAR